MPSERSARLSWLPADTAVIPVSGWASRRFSSRSVYIVSLVMFTAGSVLCGLADSVGSLVFFRVIQGIGGGMLVPTGQMILVKAAGPKNLPKVMSAIGVPIVLAPIFGPTIGGLLLEHVSWQSIFLVNLPVGIATLVAALKLLPKDKPEGAEKLDFLGLGVPPGTPSLGELLSQGKANIDAWWISLSTFAVLVVTLMLLTFMGDGLRDALDPRKAEK